MPKSLILLFLLTFAISANAAPIYKWIDEEGVINFTDDYNNVPSPYRDRVEATDYLIEGVAPSYTLDLPPQKETEARTDIFGREETWWKDKVGSWREKIREATENRERVHEKFIEKEGELSRIKYGSKSRHRIIIREMDQLKEEMIRYEAQITEANEMLKKLSKEAEESKASPDWLK
jgi:hypothetical protein